MKRYTRDEIFLILTKHKGTTVAFTENDRKKALENPSLDEFREGLKADTAMHKAVPTPAIPFSLFRRYEEDGNRKAFEDVYFERRQKLLAYALHVWLYEDEDTLVHLQDIIWTILEEYTWSLPAHLYRRGLKEMQTEQTYVVDLFAAETGHALAETLSLVGDKLHPLVTARIHREIRRRILDRAYADIGRFFWHNCTNNWSAVCAGSVGMTAIYEEEDDDRLADIICNVLVTLENFYRGFSDDGACLEGLSYWNYGFGYFMYFADMLYRRTKGEINLFDDPHIKNIAFFYTKVFFKGSRTVSFSDGASTGRCTPSALSLIAKYYPDFRIPGAKYIGFGYSGKGCARFALSVRDAVYAIPDLKSSDNEIVGTYLLPSAEWYIASSESGVGIAAKAGNNAEPHNHNDVGSFLIYKNGESVISDIGSGEYTRQYFSPDTRYTIFCNSSASHSVPIVNGEYQKPGDSYAARDAVLTEEGITADIAAAYGVDTLTSLVRSIGFDKSEGVTTLSDRYEFSAVPSSVVERFATSGKPELLDGKVEITAGNEKMSIYYEAEKCTPKISLIIDKAHSALDRKTYVIDFEIDTPSKSFDVSFEIK